METQYPEFQKAIHRLHDVAVREVSLVRKPANRMQFAVYKSEDPFWLAPEDPSPRADDEDLAKDYGSNSVVGSTRFGSGGHYQPAPAPPTRVGRKQKRKDKVYAEMCRRAQELVTRGKFKTFEQAFDHLCSNDPEFQKLLKSYYGLSEDREDSTVEKHEETWELIEKAIEETSPELPYDVRLQIVFRENPDLEAKWFWNE